jgi:hypothetical protein
MEVQVVESCSASYGEYCVMELHCRCGLVTRTVKSESAVMSGVWEGCVRDAGGVSQYQCQYQTS